MAWNVCRKSGPERLNREAGASGAVGDKAEGDAGAAST
jgi:hypothetical protein